MLANAAMQYSLATCGPPGESVRHELHATWSCTVGWPHFSIQWLVTLTLTHLHVYIVHTAFNNVAKFCGDWLRTSGWKPCDKLLIHGLTVRDLCNLLIWQLMVHKMCFTTHSMTWQTNIYHLSDRHWHTMEMYTNIFCRNVWVLQEVLWYVKHCLNMIFIDKWF